jgi:hypothetical protein
MEQIKFQNVNIYKIIFFINNLKEFFLELTIMDIPFITTISLVWLIYTYLFTEADKQILDLFNRLKFSLSVNNEGAIESEQLKVKVYMGIPEVISMGKIFEPGDIQKNNIEKFENKILSIDLFKKILVFNLFILTLHPWFYFLNCFFSMQLHIVLSLFLSLFFYWQVQLLPNLEFTRVVSTDTLG